MRYLEQLQLHNWKYIKLFCNNFFALIAVSGNYYNLVLGKRLFSKLPGELGKKIHKAWTNMNVTLVYDNMS